MNARDTILSAIRAAGVPSAPRATFPPVRAEREGLHEDFLRVLAEVGGRGTIRRGGQTIDHAVAEIVGDERDGTSIIRGRFAVAENGAVYVDAGDLESRDQVVLPDHLVLVVPFDAIVPTMHEAVRRMSRTPGCGWFLSGPSKTADIEQSLVFGAQGSRRLSVVFDPA